MSYAQKIPVWLLGSLTAVTLVYSLALLALPHTVLGFAAPTGLLNMNRPPDTVTVGGIVIEIPDPAVPLFYLTDRTRRLAVRYNGALPDFIAVQAPVVLSGTLRQLDGKAVFEAAELRLMNDFQRFSYMGGYGFYVWVSYLLAMLILFFNFLNPLRRERALLQSLARKARRQGVTDES